MARLLKSVWREAASSAPHLLQRPLLVQHFQLAYQLLGGKLAGNGGLLLVQAQIGLQPLDARLHLGHVAARLLQLCLGCGKAALVLQRARREGAQFGLDHLRVQVGGEGGALQRPALAFRAQTRLDGLGRGHAGGELFEVEAVAAQVDFQQRLALGHGLAFAHMDGGDDAAFQMLHGLHAVGRDDLAAGDHHVLHRIEQAGDHQGGDGNDEQPLAPRQGGSARGGGRCAGRVRRRLAVHGRLRFARLAQHQGEVVVAPGPHEASSCATAG